MRRVKRPRIYITSERYPVSEQSGPQYDRIRTTYAWAVAEAGGTPYVLPSVGYDPDLAPRYLDSADGLLFSGGEDIHPSLYGESVLEKCGPIDEQRDRFEIALLRGALGRGMPVLGICRGMQLIAVGSGGSLYQDLSYCERADAGHAGAWQQSGAMPSVRLMPGTVLHQVVGEETVPVNCHHHQLIKRLDEACTVSAVSPDGMIEGIEMAGRPFVLGVHWHPERLAASDLRHLKLFEALIRAASEYSHKAISRARS